MTERSYITDLLCQDLRGVTATEDQCMSPTETTETEQHGRSDSYTAIVIFYSLLYFLNLFL